MGTQSPHRLGRIGLAFQRRDHRLGYSPYRRVSSNQSPWPPTLKYNDEIIPESAIVSQFLADQHPSHLVKTSSEPGGALQRARINFFVDAFISKVQPNFYPQILAKTEEEKNEKMNAFINAVAKEVEPILKDAAPFFGGSSRLTLAEV
jgi:glutathione S-transferase